MKYTGITKYIDSIGRIKIPNEICQSLDIKFGDSICFTINENKIILNKVNNKCIFCNSQKNILEFMDKKICRKCINRF